MSQDRDQDPKAPRVHDATLYNPLFDCEAYRQWCARAHEQARRERLRKLNS